MLAAGDFCQVELLDVEENDAYPEIILGWASREYTIPRGKKVIVPFEAMANRFGDPRSGSKILPIKEPGGETTGWIPDRKAEVARLRLLWGAHADNYPRFDDISVPKIVVTDLNSEPVYTVVDDPEGKATEPVTQTADDRDALLSMLDRQQQQIDRMRADLGLEPEIAAEENLPSDDDHEPLFVGTGSNQ
jgi:hypothetical protein